MMCARLSLQERSKVKLKAELVKQTEKPIRYCQKRLINPEHEEDPRWIDIWDRFHCNLNRYQDQTDHDEVEVYEEPEDVVLTVQTLKFEGDIELTKIPRTSFKYKTISDGNKHRMFVKQTVTENEYSDEDRSSQLTAYYYDDYAKYISYSDRSRPPSAKSNAFHKSIANSPKQNKSTQVDGPQIDGIKKIHKIQHKVKTIIKPCIKQEEKTETIDVSDTIENAKITYQNTGKRKSLMISRAQSPETVQVIRVDVVCNYSTSSVLSDYDDMDKIDDCLVRLTSNLDNVQMKNNHFANKYLLTNSIKTLDESLSGGSKVTLLCKTFKLSDRLLKPPERLAGKNKKQNNTIKKITDNETTKGKRYK